MEITVIRKEARKSFVTSRLRCQLKLPSPSKWVAAQRAPEKQVCVLRIKSGTRKLDQSNPNTRESCYWFKLKKGMGLWKTPTSVMSQPIFVYPLHLSDANIPSFLRHTFQQCRQTVCNSVLLSEHWPSKVFRAAETAKVTVWESTQFLTFT
jgi:hypothetical protein